MRRVRLVALAAVSRTALVVCSSRAQAYERQWHLGADGGWSAVSYNGGVFSGWGGGVHGVYGLNDTFNLMLDLTGTSHEVFVNRPNLKVLSGAAGIRPLRSFPP